MAEAGKTYLRQTNEQGASVYSHLTDVLATLLDQKPSDALGMLEGISLSCKASTYAPSKVADAPPELPAEPAPAGWAEASSTLLAAAKAPEEGTDQGSITDVLMESKLFEHAGVGFSAAETYSVYAALVQLQQSKNLTSVRFFGKVLGTPADYYVAEGTYAARPDPEEGYEPPPPPPGAPVEEPDTGCNRFVYFVANDPAGSWTALPDVTPQQIVCSKRIRKYLTGDLAADVRAYPPFPGKEQEYLRALIARLVAATTLCPVGKFVADEEGGEPTEAEGEGDEARVPAEAAALGEVGGWCTRYMGILDIGRCTHPEEEEEIDEETGEPKPKPPKQELMPYLAPAAPAEWTAATYAHGGPPVAVARSLRWSGAYSAYQLYGGQERYASLYVGYGHEALLTADGATSAFVMEAPPPFEVEPEALVEAADLPLAEENAIFRAAKAAEIAEEAANLPDEPEAEAN